MASLVMGRLKRAEAVLKPAKRWFVASISWVGDQQAQIAAERDRLRREQGMFDSDMLIVVKPFLRQAPEAVDG
jgi:hypothetical protein